jgi:hypothetical protein
MDNRIITKFDFENHNETILNINNIKNLKFIKTENDVYNMYVEDCLFLENVSVDNKNHIKSFIKTGHKCDGFKGSMFSNGYEYVEMLIQTNCLKLAALYFIDRIDE